MANICSAVSENSSERGMVCRMSSINWPGWLGSSCDMASTSRARREISGMSSTLALVAATVNGRRTDAPRRRHRCVRADHHDVGVKPVAQEAGHGRLREHQQVTGLSQLGQHLGAQSRDAQPACLVDCRRAVVDRAQLRASSTKVAVRPATAATSATSRRSGPGEPGAGVGVHFAGQVLQHLAELNRVQRHLSGRRRRPSAAAAAPRPAPCG